MTNKMHIKIVCLILANLPSLGFSQTPDPASDPFVIGQCMAFIGSETEKGSVDTGQISYMMNPKAKSLFDKHVELSQKHPKCFAVGAKIDKCLESKKVNATNIRFAQGYNTGAVNLSNNSIVKLYSTACRD